MDQLNLKTLQEDVKYFMGVLGLHLPTLISVKPQCWSEEQERMKLPVGCIERPVIAPSCARREWAQVSFSISQIRRVESGAADTTIFSSLWATTEVTFLVCPEGLSVKSIIKTT